MGKNLQVVMDRNRDLRRESKSAVNGLPRRRQNVAALRDSAEEERQMELHERFRDRERLQRKDRDREFSKKRRVDRFAVVVGGESYRENKSTEASDEEHFEEEDEAKRRNLNRTNQPSALSSSVSNNRRNLRTLRSSPVLGTSVDEMIGVPVPRRARSTSTKRLHEYWNSGNGESQRRFSPSPASLAGAGGSSPSSSGGSMKKKMKCAVTRTHGLNSSSNSRSSSVIQDDIEIEVAEALFDLMKQSQSQFQSSQKHDKLDRDSKNTADDGLNGLKADGGKDENSAKVDSMEELEKDEKIETAQESVSGDGFVVKEKDVSPEESESPSHVKVNARENQDPIVTKADYTPIVMETKKEARLEIDLMAPPPLPSSPEREASVDIVSDPKCTTRNIQKKSETISKDGPPAVVNLLEEEKIVAITNNQLPNLDLEKHYHDTSIGKQQQQGQKEQKNQLQTSLMHFPNMSGWPGVLPGYMPPMQKPLPMNESTRSSIAVHLQTPKFKLSHPRPNRCATHEYIARNIRDHHQLIKNFLSSGPTDAANLYGNKPLNLNSMPLSQKGQNLATISGGSGKDKSSEVSSSLNATKGKKPLLQQAPLQAPANNFMHAPGFIVPLGHHQAPSNLSGSNQSSSMSFNNLNLPSNESAGSYMAILQNNGYQFQMPTLKGGQSPSAVPLFNPSFYSSQIFNLPQRQPQIPFPHAPIQTASQNTSMSRESSSIKPQQTGMKIGDNNNLPGTPATTRPSDKEMSRRGVASFPVQPINFTMIPPGKMSGGDPQQQGGSKATVAFSLPFGSNASTNPALNFSPMFEGLPEMAWNSYQMAQQKNFQTPEGKSSKNIDGLKGASIFDNLPRTVNFVPSPLRGNHYQSFPPSSTPQTPGVSVLMQNFHQHQHQQQLIQLQNHHMQQMQLNQTTQMKASRDDNSPKISHISFSNCPVLPAATQGATIVGSPSNSSTSKNTGSNSQQQTEASPNGSNQKSSPACRRNVPSILSTRSSQLPEIKYG